jgi:gamma-glutamylcyclotransferase (GGCT)/AIG2-like uncharacterized protein YtfP
LAVVLLFVYGSLKRGEKNHSELGEAPYRGTARTAPDFAITHVGPYRALTAGRESIDGEIYEVDEELLTTLDAFEGRNYRRIEIRLSDGRGAHVYVESRWGDDRGGMA